MDNTTQQTEEVKKNDEGQQATAAEPVAPENKAAENATEKQGNETRLQAELAESKDKYLRLYSEFENFRRRTAKERLELIQSANEQLIKSLLPVADDFERAEKSFKEQSNIDTEGFTLIRNKFKKVLEQYGVKAMVIETGADFNADFHEAITQIPAPDPSLKGKIIDVVEKGYLLNEKVIRYAKVVVGN